MKVLVIMFLTWPVLALAIPPDAPGALGQVQPKASFPGQLLKVIDNETIVTSEIRGRSRLLTLRYWNVDSYEIVDSVEVTPVLETVLDSEDKRETFYWQYALALSPDESLLAIMLDDSVNVVVVRLDSLTIVQSFKDDAAKGDRNIEFLTDGKTIAFNNQNNGINLWDLATGSLEVTYFDSFSTSRAVSPDRSLVAYELRHFTELADVNGRWLVRLNTWGYGRWDYEEDISGRVEFSPDGRFLCASNQAHSHRFSRDDDDHYYHNTWLWDLSHFPPHNAVSGEVVVVDSLGNPIEGLKMTMSSDGYDFFGFFEAVTDSRGRIPVVTPRDGRYRFHTLYLWEDVDWSVYMYRPRTSWPSIPIRRGPPFTLKLVLAGGLFADRSRPWELSGQTVGRADLEIEIPGYAALVEERHTPQFIGYPLLPVLHLRVYRPVSGTRTRPVYSLPMNASWDSLSQITGRAAFTISDYQSVTGLYDIELSDSDSIERWSGILINDGHRLSLRLPLGGTPVRLSEVQLVLRHPRTLSKLSGDNQRGSPGGELVDPFVTSVRDQNGEPLPGAVVTFAVAGEGGTLSAVSDTTDAEGLAATTLTLGEEFGIYTVVVTVADLESVTFTATAGATPDFDADGQVGFSDFFLFAEAFGGSDPLFDLDGSGSVDLGDFFLFVDHFEDPARGKLQALARERLGLPDGPQLQQNAPNPFNSGTVISWFQLQPGPARLEVFALTGQRVAVLHEGPKEAGLHRLRWGGRDERGRPLASGVYVYRLVTAEAVQLRKLTVLR